MGETSHLVWQMSRYCFILEITVLWKNDYCVFVCLYTSCMPVTFIACCVPAVCIQSLHSRVASPNQSRVLFFTLEGLLFSSCILQT